MYDVVKGGTIIGPAISKVDIYTDFVVKKFEFKQVQIRHND